MAKGPQTSHPKQTSLFTQPTLSPSLHSPTISSNIIHSTIFRAGRNGGSFFLDVSSRAETESILFQLILQQYPNCRGAAPFREGGRRFIEVNIDPTEMLTTQDFIHESILFSDNKRILPIRALPDASNIKWVSLTRMPFLSKEDLINGLTTTLSKYGYVHDIGISTDPISNMFLGSDYAIIDTTPSSDGSPLPALTHNLPWPGMKNGFFATCTSMTDFCKYCHKDGHTRENCPIAPPLRLCYNCICPHTHHHDLLATSHTKKI